MHDKQNDPLTTAGSLRVDRPNLIKRILVVEDEDRWREGLALILHERGLVVDTASSIKEATELLRRNEYDIAFLDLRLSEDDDADAPPSGSSGLGLARLIHEHSPATLIIILTAYGLAVREAMHLGVADFLDKSDFSDERVNRTLDKVISRRETELESIRRNQINRLMYETLSMMSHELRTPLITIQRNVEALILGALGTLSLEQTEAVREIEYAVKRESLLLNSHLDLNRIERGAERLHYQEYDLVKLVRDEILAHQSEAKHKRVKLLEQLPEQQATVKIDVNRFRVALNPLMDNAIKFSPEGGEIFIITQLRNGYVEVQISDQGPGIKPEEIDDLFNMQAGEPTNFTQRIRSSGLGLSMAKRMIELHGGTLWIESDGKNGTKVNFRLPIKD
jgi:signal transduction histidine kinase